MKNFYCIKNEGMFETVIKKSKFLCFGKVVKTESEARQFIELIKKQHFDARHNCSAFILSNGITRSSDVGEPSGTAGVPMLEVMKGNNLENVVFVITRYFGGIKLGVGGLIRAYQESINNYINNFGLVEISLQNVFEFEFQYELVEKLKHLIKNDDNLNLVSIDYLAKPIVKVSSNQELEYINNLLLTRFNKEFIIKFIEKKEVQISNEDI